MQNDEVRRTLAESKPDSGTVPQIILNCHLKRKIKAQFDTCSRSVGAVSPQVLLTFLA